MSNVNTFSFVRNQRGVTLVELMVAMLLGLILLPLLARQASHSGGR